MSKTPAPSLLYFINSGGAGHWQRAQGILRHLSMPVVCISSKAPKFIEFKENQQAIDVPPLYTSTDNMVMSTRVINGVFADDAVHVPRALKAAYIKSVVAQVQVAQQYNCQYALLDVSAETAMMMRLCGIPYCYIGMHGKRDDRAHQQIYRAADAILSCYPKRLEDPNTPSWVTDKTIYVNGIANVEGAADITFKPPFPEDKPTILFVKPRGKSSLTAEYLEKLSKQLPQYYWYGIGFDENIKGENYCVETFVQQPLAYMKAADIIVANAGDNSVFEAGYLNKPLIAKPEPRFFDEQLHKAELLKAENLAVIVDDWPEEPSAWQRLLEQAKTLDSWEGLIQEDASQKAAEAINARFEACCG